MYEVTLMHVTGIGPPFQKQDSMAATGEKHCRAQRPPITIASYISPPTVCLLLDDSVGHADRNSFRTCLDNLFC